MWPSGTTDHRGFEARLSLLPALLRPGPRFMFGIINNNIIQSRVDINTYAHYHRHTYIAIQAFTKYIERWPPQLVEAARLRLTGTAVQRSNS